MRLLILGSVGPYPERLSNFIENGHQVWYVCTERLPYFFEQYPPIIACTIWEMGTTPEQVAAQIVKLIEEEHIQVVYSLLNVWDGSNRTTAALLRNSCPVPVVRHYKEHYLKPFEEECICIEQSTGVIFINEESKNYFASIYHLPKHSACLDADLIPRRYLAGTFQPKLSSLDNQPHLLIAGTASIDGGRYDYRDLIEELTIAGAHVHLYGQFRELRSTGQLKNSAEIESAYRNLGKEGYLHIHPPISPAQFVEEWSRYDAGLLHVPRAGDPFRTLNIPNRYSAYIAAGLSVALQGEQMPAMQRQLDKLNAGIIYNNISDLVSRLPDEKATNSVMAIRESVTFEAIFPELIKFIHQCIE